MPPWELYERWGLAPAPASLANAWAASMAPLVVLALLALPFLEIAVFVAVGERIGAGPTVALALLGSAAGIVLLRIQGLATLARARDAALANQPPLDELLDGLAILLAGALLIIPGFITDVLGLLLFVPGLRWLLLRRLWRAFATRERRSHGAVIETDYIVLEREPRRHPPLDKGDKP